MWLISFDLTSNNFLTPGLEVVTIGSGFWGCSLGVWVCCWVVYTQTYYKFSVNSLWCCFSNYLILQSYSKLHGTYNEVFPRVTLPFSTHSKSSSSSSQFSQSHPSISRMSDQQITVTQVNNNIQKYVLCYYSCCV